MTNTINIQTLTNTVNINISNNLIDFYTKTLNEYFKWILTFKWY